MHYVEMRSACGKWTIAYTSDDESKARMQYTQCVSACPEKDWRLILALDYHAACPRAVPTVGTER